MKKEKERDAERMQKEIDSLRKDRERLEWLLENSAQLVLGEASSGLLYGTKAIWKGRDSWRDAIDEAMDDALTVREKVNPECTK